MEGGGGAGQVGDGSGRLRGFLSTKGYTLHLNASSYLKPNSELEESDNSPPPPRTHTHTLATPTYRAATMPGGQVHFSTKKQRLTLQQ